MKAIKKLFKWGIMGVGLIVVLVIVVSMIGGDPSTDTSVEKASGEVNEEKPKEKSDDKPKAPKAKIGDTLNVEDVAYTVNSTKTVANVGGDYGSTAQGKYLVLNVVVKNNGDDSLMVDGSFFKLKYDGKTYEADTMASTMANETGKSFFLEQLNPGIEQEGNIVFDVPADVATSKGLTLQVQTGAFGTETGTIKLAK